ncbi:alternative ribosome rescue aminoacyl-tRNA hydrolase ArfB [Sandaracinobacteroides saxicola]|uniref:Aminoacyl-tRNA hydrolase n=1 Tax=Sandaracinobacteroides saxicola TaxID=2759707 RepID=A0A7G5IHW4_9SPHN|nr:alternative ribosome rescue aminoacyl-tRNA hydrolase ArfB [Sandaracinobacteroides saxicola]QMW22956.1 aminoacyl-tRNA hydrolase [Sandaracinobacteroides saxicola]
MTLRINHRYAIEEAELDLSYIAARGPGGQNVNKVATAAQLRFDLFGSPSLPDEVKARAIPIAGSRLTQDGIIVLTADRFRTQLANRRDAIERLLAILAEAAVRPTIRRATKPSKAAKARRVEAKAKRGTIKAGRGRVRED